jgi:hypothetical protein
MPVYYPGTTLATPLQVVTVKAPVLCLWHDYTMGTACPRCGKVAGMP